MTAKEVSDGLAMKSTAININLPSWTSSTATALTEQQMQDESQRKKRNQLYIGIGILAVLVVSLFMIKKK